METGPKVAVRLRGNEHCYEYSLSPDVILLLLMDGPSAIPPNTHTQSDTVTQKRSMMHERVKKAQKYNTNTHVNMQGCETASKTL